MGSYPALTVVTQLLTQRNLLVPNTYILYYNILFIDSELKS